VNACSSSEIAETLTQCADFVIGTTAEVTDRGAIVMAATLFSYLAQGESVAAAFDAARTLLQVVDEGRCDATLWPKGRDAEHAVLVPTFRILAAFPKLDEALRIGRKRPPQTVDARRNVRFEFGVAGSPDDVIQLVFFTDDLSFLEYG